MFCHHRGETALLVWYDDPTSVEEEMRPPAVKLGEETTLYDRGVGNPSFTLITHDQQFEVSRGALRLESDGKAVFDEFQTKESSYLDFEKTIARNQRLLQRALSCNEKKDVPDFHSDENQLVEPETLSLDTYWVGALAISRAEVTQFLVFYMTVDVEDKKPFLKPADAPSLAKMKGMKTKPKIESGIFFSWYPTAKPGNLQNWLDKLHSDVSEEGKQLVHNTLSPIIEGYYRVAAVDYKRDVHDKPIEIIYDDVSNMASNAYFDMGATPDPKELFFRPKDSHRGKLTLSTPLCVSTEKDEDLDWGFTGLTPLGWLFLVPLKAGIRGEFLTGPVRVSLKGEKRFQALVKRERLKNFKTGNTKDKVERTFTPLRVDAELNLTQLPGITALMKPSREVKRAIEDGIRRTAVDEDAVPPGQEPRRGKTTVVPPKRLIRQPGPSSSQDQSAGEAAVGAQMEPKPSEALERRGQGPSGAGPPADEFVRHRNASPGQEQPAGDGEEAPPSSGQERSAGEAGGGAQIEPKPSEALERRGEGPSGAEPPAGEPVRHSNASPGQEQPAGDGGEASRTAANVSPPDPVPDKDKLPSPDDGDEEAATAFLDGRGEDLTKRGLKRKRT